MTTARRYQRNLRSAALGAVLCLSQAVLFSATLPKLNLQTAPISRETKVATSFAAVVKAAERSVVNVYTSRRLKERSWQLPDDPLFRYFFGGPDFNQRLPEEQLTRSLGSGVIVSSDGYLLSNNHVVEGADDIHVVMSDGREFTATVVGADAPTDAIEQRSRQAGRRVLLRVWRNGRGLYLILRSPKGEPFP